MGGEEGMSNGGSAGEKVQCLKSEASNNGFSDDGGSGPSEGLRIYKRRKHTRSSLGRKGQEDERGSPVAARKIENEELLDHVLESDAPVDGPNDVSHKECRSFVLKHICQSLNNDEGGIQGRIQDAVIMTVKESDDGDKDRNKWASQSGCRPNGSHFAARGNMDVIVNESLADSYRPVTKMCQDTFLNIIHSEKFILLCKLLSDNFQEMKPDNLLSLSHIRIRMKDGVYEQSPVHFHEDIQRVWKKLQGIGSELVSLAKSLSDVSSSSYDEQFCSRETYFHDKPEQIEACSAYSVCTCRSCGHKADGRDRLVCDSCEETYHISCIEPIVKEIPPRSWYCAVCSARGMGSPHENCAVCERLNGRKVLYTQAGDDNRSPTIENLSSESAETSNHTEDDIHQSSAGCKNVSFCKMCGSELDKGEKIKICEHLECPYKYYHVRCLTMNLLKSYGPFWYCPSCLCRGCLVDKDDDQIVLCDGCDHAYHMYCMSPPQSSVPTGKWFCGQCDLKIKEIRRAKRAYEKRENRMNLDEKLEPEADKGRIDMLVTAALNL
ncbi:PHD finger protein EHD3 isoform X2 [Mercurialis annua]|uniref:PHD finger protein EHD3 isoform X2 n=1 Tax=Mercurialis annua TaxID=3986 RepID=UPI002160DA57|nr:PHD finger protein EHD3 isoform X2 [Mercurialis annua]